MRSRVGQALARRLKKLGQARQPCHRLGFFLSFLGTLDRVFKTILCSVRRIMFQATPQKNDVAFSVDRLAVSPKKLERALLRTTCTLLGQQL